MSRRVLVVGLRMTGDAVVRHCCDVGDHVVVAEEHPEQPRYPARAAEARALGAEIVEAPGADAWPALVAAADLVVPSPGVAPGHPVLAAAEAAGVPIVGDVDIAVEMANAPVIAVTGTNGKSTVTTLTAAMLEAAGKRAVAAGNIGWALLDAMRQPMDVLVAEVSSFQLHYTTTAFRPRVAVLLNIADDHLDWHGSFAAYRDAKAQVFRHQAGEDLLVFNADDAVVREMAATAPARTVGFSISPDAETGYHVRGGQLLAPDGTAFARVEELALQAPHDIANALASAAAAFDLGATPDAVRGALARAARLHHRVEPVGQAGGVRFFDDSKATNPHATLTAVRGFDSAILIAGGRNKGLDLGVLREVAPRLRGVVAIGEAAPEVVAALGDTVPTVTATSMREAVRLAAGRAQPGDAVLLSPACASYDWYSGYDERGRDFQAEVAAYLEEVGA